MKITRTELKEMIKEVLREELSKKPLVEEKEFRSELRKLWSTPEGRAKYDSMTWDERIPLHNEDRKVDPVDIALAKLDDFELEYGGFDREWHKDHWDPNSDYGHYTVDGADYYDDFTYKVEATDMFEYLTTCLEQEKNPGRSPFIKEYFRLTDIWEAAPDYSIESTEAEDAMNLYLINNIDEFFKIYEEDIYDHFQEDAYDWAGDHLHPVDPADWYED